MKRTNKILWGIVLIALGVIFALNAMDIASIDIFFDGWWTLFIIIPCFIGLFTQREKTGNIIGLLIGVFLLLCCQDILSFDMLWKLALPLIIIIIGAKMIFGGIFGNRSAKIVAKIKENGGDLYNASAIFSEQKADFNGKIFTGAELNAVFGGVKCDLRGALIETDCVINAYAIFGGIDISVPDNVNIKVSSTSIFGGISNKTKNITDENAVTLYINGVCMFGGIEIK